MKHFGSNFMPCVVVFQEIWFIKLFAGKIVILDNSRICLTSKLI